MLNKGKMTLDLGLALLAVVLMLTVTVIIIQVTLLARDVPVIPWPDPCPQWIAGTLEDPCARAYPG